MCRILVTEYRESLVELVLLDIAVSCQVSARWAMVDKVVFRKEALGTGVVAGREVNLCEPEGILGIIW